MNSRHPPPESLLALATGDLAGLHRFKVAWHLRTCRPCGEAEQVLAKRLIEVEEIREPLPGELLERAMAVLPTSPRGLAIDTLARAKYRQPIWALAAGVAGIALVWLGGREWLRPSAGELDRGIAVEHVLYVKQPSLEIRSAPDAATLPSATLHRGDRVVVLERREAWWKIKQSEDGPEGWVRATELVSGN